MWSNLRMQAAYIYPSIAYSNDILKEKCSVHNVDNIIL